MKNEYQEVKKDFGYYGTAERELKVWITQVVRNFF
jgi:hypothetical protein